VELAKRAVDPVPVRDGIDDVEIPFGNPGILCHLLDEVGRYKESSSGVPPRFPGFDPVKIPRFEGPEESLRGRTRPSSIADLAGHVVAGGKCVGLMKEAPEVRGVLHHDEGYPREIGGGPDFNESVGVHGERNFRGSLGRPFADEYSFSRGSIGATISQFIKCET
jgi:hypothetical protein